QRSKTDSICIKDGGSQVADLVLGIIAVRLAELLAGTSKCQRIRVCQAQKCRLVATENPIGLWTGAV
ncbi:unnamed protein product, partial [Ranitomeya imitator]